MLDITKKENKETGVDGKIAEHVLEEVGISCNKNMIPFDPRPPMNPSGIRLGTPAVTTRGLGEEDMKTIAGIIDQALLAHDNPEALAALKKQIQELCERYPLWY